MEYIKLSRNPTEFQGESFSKSLGKKNNSEWGSTEVGNYILTDENGDEVASDNLTKSGDSLSLSFILGKTDTADLEGVYTLLAYQTDTSNAEINKVIAEYKITYKTRELNNG